MPAGQIMVKANSCPQGQFIKGTPTDVCDRAVYSNQQEKDRECFYTLCPLFLTSTASVSTEAILILSICRRFARLDIFALQQIRYVFATLKLDMI